MARSATKKSTVARRKAISLSDFEISGRRRVANRALPTRIVAALDKLGQMTGPEAALAAYGWPRAVHRRRLIPVLEPTLAQLSATRRVLARLKADQLVVDAGHRRRRKLYRLRADAERLDGLTLGIF